MNLSTLRWLWLILLLMAGPLWVDAAPGGPAASNEDLLWEAQNKAIDAERMLHEGEYRSALLLLQQTLSVREKLLGPGADEVERTLEKLRQAYEGLGDRAKADQLAARFTEAYRALHPEQPGAYTFWDYQGGALQLDHGIRIDHLLLSPLAADRLAGCTIDKDPRLRPKASDHTPVIVELRG